MRMLPSKKTIGSLLLLGLVVAAALVAMVPAPVEAAPPSTYRVEYYDADWNLIGFKELDCHSFTRSGITSGPSVAYTDQVWFESCGGGGSFTQSCTDISHGVVIRCPTWVPSF